MSGDLRPCVVLLMGVTGSGKSTTGELLGRRLGWPFRDADSFHPPANVSKMSRGIPLTDDDRGPWLQAIGSWMDERLAAGESAVVTCSALKRTYRDTLVADRTGVRLVHLVGSKALIGSRLARRRDHFMPPALLDSQFATLEDPGPDEGVVTVAVTAPPDQVVDEIVRRLGLRGA